MAGDGRHGIAIAPFDDTMLLSYVIDGGSARAATAWTSCRSAGSATRRSPSRTSPAPARNDDPSTWCPRQGHAYAAEDADITLRLWQC
jgi:DNA polymerase-1